MTRSILVPIIFLIVNFTVGVIVVQFFALYGQFPWLDNVLHFLGGAGVAWFFAIMFLRERKELSWFADVMLLVGSAAFVGIVWEIAEYLAFALKDILPSIYSVFHGGDLPDTISDLALDIGGAFLFWLLLLCTEKKRTE